MESHATSCVDEKSTTSPQPSRDISLQAHIEEYVALRQEMLEIIKLQRQVLALVIGVGAAALPFIADRLGKGNFLILFIAPIPLSIFGLIHLSLEAQHITVGRYITDVLRPRVLVHMPSESDLWEWERWHRSPQARQWPVLHMRSLLSIVEFLVLFLPSPLILTYLFRTQDVAMCSGEGLLFIAGSLLALFYLIGGVIIVVFKSR